MDWPNGFSVVFFLPSDDDYSCQLRRVVVVVVVVNIGSFSVNVANPASFSCCLLEDMEIEFSASTAWSLGDRPVVPPTPPSTSQRVERVGCGSPAWELRPQGPVGHSVLRSWRSDGL